MNTTKITRLAMVVAGAMLAHQVASKAVREAVFLSGPGVSKLPAMVMVTALAVVAAVPAYARVLAAWGPRTVVPAGFLASAVGHLVEWQLPAANPWVAVLVYLHVAGFGALLLSGFWSLLSEIFDPRKAKESYGPIAAAGTAGGLLGGAAILAAPLHASLLVLAVLHAGCAAGIWWIGHRAPHTTLADASGPPPGVFDWGVLRRAPYLGTLALLVGLSTASAGIVDYLFKKGVADWAVTREGLQQFFALFYMGVGVLTFAAQAASGSVVRVLGLGRTISTLPAGLGAASVVATIVPSFVPVALTRGTESVLRGSWFRSGYELLFVPMAPDEKRRTKTFLDVTCDRAGDAVGAAIVQALIFAAALTPFVASSQSALMLGIVVAMAIAGLWLSRRVDALYLGVVAGRLADQVDADTIAVQSETGWTLLELPPELRAARPAAAPVPAPQAPPPEVDPRLRLMADLRSGDRARVEAALRSLTRPDRSEVAQVIQLLAWDDLAPLVRHTLEKVAASHAGLLEDALCDRETDFAIRRRIPKVLSSVASERALQALITGLDDVRFEVRYQCARAINRMLARKPSLKVDPEVIMAVVERELSVPLQVWQGHRLLDQSDPDEEMVWPQQPGSSVQRNLEHMFSLLAIVLPREPLLAAFQGLQSNDPELRALTLEYLEGVLPPAVLVRLWALPDFGPPTPSSGDAP